MVFKFAQILNIMFLSAILNLLRVSSTPFSEIDNRIGNIRSRREDGCEECAICTETCEEKKKEIDGICKKYGNYEECIETLKPEEGCYDNCIAHVKEEMDFEKRNVPRAKVPNCNEGCESCMDVCDQDLRTAKRICPKSDDSKLCTEAYKKIVQNCNDLCMGKSPEQLESRKVMKHCDYDDDYCESCIKNCNVYIDQGKELCGKSTDEKICQKEFRRMAAQCSNKC